MIKNLKILLSTSLILALAVSSGCSSNIPLSSGNQEISRIHNQPVLPVEGKVIFDEEGFSAKATLTEAGTKATVSIIYPHDHATMANVTVATGLTDTNGNFTINPSVNFTPAINDLFVLEAVKRIGSVNKSVMTLRTFIRWKGNGWESMTFPNLYINTKTTALAVIAGLNTDKITSADTINKIDTSGGSSVPLDIPSPLFEGDIYFETKRNGNSDLYSMLANGTNQSNITNNAANEMKPKISPDGSTLVFEMFDGTYADQVYSVKTDGTGLTQLTTSQTVSSYEPSWSHDGSKIVFQVLETNFARQIYSMNADGTNKQLLSINAFHTDQEPSYSPDSSKIVFVSTRNFSNYDIFTMNADGTNHVNLTNDQYQDRYPAYSSDGNKIVFSSNRDGNMEIYTMNTDGTGIKRLTNSANEDIYPVFTTTGKILFTSKRNNNIDIYRMDATDNDNDGNGDNLVRLTTHSADDIYPSTSSYTIKSQTILNVAKMVTEVLNKNLDPMRYITLKNNIYTISNPPSIYRSVFVSDRDGNNNIYIMDGGDGGNLVRLTSLSFNENNPVLSPDVRKVAYETNLNTHSDIYVMNADGTSPVRLTTDVGNDKLPAWSPDGTKIAFVTDRNSGQNDIYFMNAADGTGLTKLTSDTGNDTQPSWSPDGTKITFISDRSGNNEVYVMSAVNGLEGGSNPVTKLTDTAQAETFPAWSPDGSQITFISARDGNNEVYKMNADGSSQARLTANTGDDSKAVWSPDGSRIMFSSTKDSSNYQLFSMDTSGGNVVRIYSHSYNDNTPDWK